MERNHIVPKSRSIPVLCNKKYYPQRLHPRLQALLYSMAGPISMHTPPASADIRLEASAAHGPMKIPVALPRYASRDDKA